MQHPVGYVIPQWPCRNGQFLNNCSKRLCTRPILPYRVEWFINSRRNYHGYQCMALMRNNATDFYRRSAKWGMVIALVFGTLGALAGHHQGQYITKYNL